MPNPGKTGPDATMAAAPHFLFYAVEMLHSLIRSKVMVDFLLVGPLVDLTLASFDPIVEIFKRKTPDVSPAAVAIPVPKLVLPHHLQHCLVHADGGNTYRIVWIGWDIVDERR